MRYDAGDEVIEDDYWVFQCRVLNRVWLHKESIGKNWKGVGKSLVSQQQLQFDLGRSASFDGSRWATISGDVVVESFR